MRFVVKKNIVIGIILVIIIAILVGVVAFISASDVLDIINWVNTNLNESEGKTITIHLKDGIGIDDLK